MTMHPWHGIDPGKRAPEIVDCLIEIPRGSRNKYELDKATGLLRLDRVLYSAVFYPANYGFIPRTYCDDRDPLDILVLGQEAIVPMCILTARPIGVMQMVDQDEEDDKIIAVHEHDPAFSHYRDISELPQHTLYELQQFFEDYKVLEHKKVRIERRKGCADAQEIINQSLRLYQDSFTADGSKRADAPILASEMLDHADHDSPHPRSPSHRVRTDAARRAAARYKAHDEESALFTTYNRRADEHSAQAEHPTQEPAVQVSGVETNHKIAGPALESDAIDESTMSAHLPPDLASAECADGGSANGISADGSISNDSSVDSGTSSTSSSSGIA